VQQSATVARLEAELALAASDPPLLLRGGAVDMLPDAVARMPTDAPAVVITTWALSGLAPADRLRFRQRFDALGTERPVVWVSAEGVGVAPGIPTLGDRRASGRSLVGLAVFDRSGMRAGAVGRCWSQGRLMSWLAA